MTERTRNLLTREPPRLPGNRLSYPSIPTHLANVGLVTGQSHLSDDLVPGGIVQWPSSLRIDRLVDANGQRSRSIEGPLASVSPQYSGRRR